MRIRSLAEKIVLYFVTIGIIAIAVVSTYSFHTSKNALLDRTFDQLTSVRVVKKGQIEQFFNDRLSEMLLVLNTENLPINADSGMIFKAIDCFILEHLQSSNYYKAIYFIKPDKSIISFNLKNGPDFYAQSGMRDYQVLAQVISATNQIPVLHDYVFDSISGQPRMFITGIYKIQNNVSVQIALEISLDAINLIMLEKNPASGLGHSGESYLVGFDGLMRSSSRFQTESILKTEVRTDAVKQAQEGQTGTTMIMDYRGIEVLSSYSKLNVPGLNWVILAEIDYKEATKSIYWIRNNILLLSILVVAVVFIISFVFSKRITLPLIKLNDATKHIQEGDLDVSLPKIKNDEIGQLTNSFNEMAHTLKSKETELQTERNMRITAMIDGQELERQRLSRELHDGLGQSLIALKLMLAAAEGKRHEDTLETIEQTCIAFDDTINEIRRISNDLMPAVLLEFGLITALKNLCNSIADTTGMNIEFSSKGQLNDLSQRITIYIFRIIQEALNNMVKHADASRATLHIERNPEAVFAMIQDNGKGIEMPEQPEKGGSGIPNMRERVRLLNGSIEFISESGKGTRLNIEIPLITNNNGNY